LFNDTAMAARDARAPEERDAVLRDTPPAGPKRKQ